MNLKDAIATMPPNAAIRAAYNCASGTQGNPTVDQVVGAAIFLVAAADILKLDVRAMLNQAERYIKDGDTFYDREAKALRDYIRGELA